MAIIHDANLAAGKGESIVQGAKQEEDNPYMKDMKQMAAAKMFGQAMGGALNDKDHADGLPVQILKSAMENNAALVKQANDMVIQKDKLAEDLRTKVEASQNNLYGLMFGEMQKTAAELRAVVEKVNENKPPPRDALTTIKEAKDLISMIGNEMFGSRLNTPAPVESNEALALKKKQMEWEHDERLVKLQAEIAHMQNEMTLKLEELKDNKELKKMEREDAKKFREGAFAQITDIAQAAAAGFKSKTGDVGAQAGQEHPAAEPAQSGGAGIMAAIESFPCQNCGTKLAVPEKGDKVVCPECDTTYTLKRAVTS